MIKLISIFYEINQNFMFENCAEEKTGVKITTQII